MKYLLTCLFIFTSLVFSFAQQQQNLADNEATVETSIVSGIEKVERRVDSIDVHKIVEDLNLNGNKPTVEDIEKIKSTIQRSLLNLKGLDYAKVDTTLDDLNLTSDHLNEIFNRVKEELSTLTQDVEHLLDLDTTKQKELKNL